MPKQEKVKVNVKERVEDKLIDLSLSDISDVPVRDIVAFKRATILDLSSNKIISLGKNFGLLTHITKLDLSKNQIRYLPDDFGKLKLLRHLDLYQNRIEHLPLSFGNLTNLRYLDLKSNPLFPALAKIVGQCLTTKDCNESARNTVKFLAHMQQEVEHVKAKLQEENEAEIEEIDDAKKIDAQKNNKKNKKKNKNKKNRKDDSSQNNNIGKIQENGELIRSDSQDLDDENLNKSNSVFKTISIFFFLLILNIIMLYIVTVKYPEIADKIAESIPPKYRNKILLGVEDMKLNFLKVSDWLQKFITPPNKL